MKSTTASAAASWFVAVAVLLVLAHAAATSTGLQQEKTLVCGQADQELAVAHIACPPNTVIVKIPFVAYGLPTGSCPHYYRRSECDSWTALNVVASLCLGRNNCSVAQNGKHGPMGDPCSGVNKRLRVVVQCAPEPKAPLPSLAPSQGSYVCGHADREEAYAPIECPHGSRIVAIPFASYGTPTGSCPNFAVDPKCHANSTMSLVAGLCYGSSICRVVQDVAHGPTGDPCFGVNKRLRFVAQCEPAPSATPLFVSPLPSLAPSNHYVCGATELERDWAHISCPAGLTIVGVPFASYGTPVGICPNFAVDPGCDTRGMREMVASLCVGRSSCSVQQDHSSVLGDPCVGIHKRLRVVVECAPSPPMTLVSASPSVSASPTTTATPSPAASPSASPLPAVSSYVCGAADIEHQFAQVSCPADWVVEAISFASYGLPTGACPCFKAEPQCDARPAVEYATGLCLGRNNCSIQQNGWGPLGDPCPNVLKRLRVVARCIPPPAAPPDHHQDVPAHNGGGSTGGAPSPLPSPTTIEERLWWLPRSVMEVLLWLVV